MAVFDEGWKAETMTRQQQKSVQSGGMVVQYPMNPFQRSGLGQLVTTDRPIPIGYERWRLGLAGGVGNCGCNGNTGGGRGGVLLPLMGLMIVGGISLAVVLTAERSR